MQNNQNKTVLRLTESGILLAIGILIDTFLKFDATWAYGGSITLCSMLPLVIIAYKYGAGWGCLAGLAHGLITMMISGGRAGGLAAMIEENGGICVGITCVVDRTKPEAPSPIPIVASALKLDLPNYAPEECPICKEGKLPLVHLGSRKMKEAAKQTL